jgi:TRAP-type C4-dicarboxylate transport system permease small subunit
MRRSVFNLVDAGLGKVTWLLSAVSGGLMVLLTLVVFGEIVSRYLFSLPITFSSELTTIIFPWIVCLMAVEITRNGDHIAITLFRDLTPLRLQRILIILTELVMLAFAGMLAYASYELCLAARDITLPVLTFLTKVYQYSAITLSFSLVTVVLLLRLVRDLRTPLTTPLSGPAITEAGQ